ncbi:heavy-metal-associated domain-containing protein [Citricoccus parietis]|uniref:Heavy-metal-associated domain-containing protein n=2 Tax=Citricoccus parietis TaxID=592307 RepID=A0ABV5G600_9MICC
MQDTTRTPLPMATTGCACCAPAAESTATTTVQAPGVTGAPAPAGISTYPVEGMTCGHCVTSVTEELSALDGVATVDVDLVPGGVSTVTVTGPVAPAAVRAAIEEAGYTPAS